MLPSVAVIRSIFRLSALLGFRVFLLPFHFISVTNMVGEGETKEDTVR